MKTILAVLLAAAAPLIAGPAAQTPAGKTAASDSGLGPLQRKYAAKREALLKRYGAKRRALIDSSAWKAMSAETRRSKLDALAAELDERERRLAARYDAEVRAQKGMRDAEDASEDQERQRQLDQFRSQAAQDALRGQKAP